MAELYAQVILPLSLQNTFTYRIPENMSERALPGQRVIVQFGKNKMYAALISKISDQIDIEVEPKEIIQFLDEDPVVFEINLKLWMWISEYYCCMLGDVFRAALPSGLKMESSAEIGLTDEIIENQLTAKEEFIVNALVHKVSTLSDLQKQLGKNFSFHSIKSLTQKGILFIDERISQDYKPKSETFVKLHPDILSEELLNKRLSELKKAPKQAEMLLHFCQISKAFNDDQLSFVPKKLMVNEKSLSAEALNGLIKKNILLQFRKNVSRLKDVESQQMDLTILNQHQEKALSEIRSVFDHKSVVLLHGVTASGKTEIYIHLIDEVLKKGKQALYLLPEIALTTQIINRLKSVFGNRTGIYHSKMSSPERVEVWEKVAEFRNNSEKGYQIVLGARSALFLPFSDLGIIIVDEEHETSFKQQDPAPRYHARDTAVMMGFQNNAKVLLGSATPSFESYYNALSGKYGLVTLNVRHSEIDLPELIVADLTKSRLKRQMHSVLTPQLYNLTVNALEKKEQVIFFQNRRGYSPFIECSICAHVPKCINCDVSLTFHKSKDRLTCHYCGYNTKFPEKCPKCGSPEIKSRGFGTEKIEDEVKSLFRNARVDRMDLDTTQSKNAFERIIGKLENRKTDILVGTQMVTKGLDFDHVSVVGILNADNLINFPDFRSYERAYQLISQVSGRAGRKNSRGNVVIQTTQPDIQLIHLIKNQDYTTLFKTQAEERLLFKYPPYFRLLKITVKHKNIETVNRVADTLGIDLRKIQNLIILGPEFPLIGRVQLWHLKEIWVKTDRKLNQAVLKNRVMQCIVNVKQQPNNSSCIIQIDVDPS